VAVTTIEKKLGLHVMMMFLIMIMVTSMNPKGAAPLALRWKVAAGLAGEMFSPPLAVQGFQGHYPIRCIILVLLLQVIIDHHHRQCNQG